MRARSPEEAVALVLRDRVEEADARYDEPDPNPRFYVRLAHGRGPWQLVYEHEAAELASSGAEDGTAADTHGR